MVFKLRSSTDSMRRTGPLRKKERTGNSPKDRENKGLRKSKYNYGIKMIGRTSIQENSEQRARKQKPNLITNLTLSLIL